MNLVLWSALRQLLPFRAGWWLLESGHWLRVRVEVGTRFELGEIATCALVLLVGASNG